MALPTYGLALRGGNPGETIDLIVRAEAAGVGAAWVTTGGAGPDGLTALAVAAARTARIMVGTAITPTYPRHPLVLLQQAQVFDSVAPGRLTLGVGGSHRPSMEGSFGLAMGHPLEHLREYVTILNQGRAGKVAFEGEYFRVRAELPGPVNVPVMISALRRNAFELAGELTDGAISWLCPPPYLERVALPAMRDGAERAGRAVPTLVAHTVVARTTDRAAVGRAIQAGFRNYTRLPFYQRMFADAGYPEALDSVFSEAMTDAIVAWGDDAAIRDRLRALAGLGDVSVLATPLPVDGQPVAEAAAALFDILQA